MNQPAIVWLAQPQGLPPVVGMMAHLSKEPVFKSCDKSLNSLKYLDTVPTVGFGEIVIQWLDNICNTKIWWASFFGLSTVAHQHGFHHPSTPELPTGTPLARYLGSGRCSVREISNFVRMVLGGSSVINETIVSAKWWETSQNLEIQSDITLKRKGSIFWDMPSFGYDDDVCTIECFSSPSRLSTCH